MGNKRPDALPGNCGRLVCSCTSSHGSTSLRKDRFTVIRESKDFFLSTDGVGNEACMGPRLLLGAVHAARSSCSRSGMVGLDPRPTRPRVPKSTTGSQSRGIRKRVPLLFDRNLLSDEHGTPSSLRNARVCGRRGRHVLSVPGRVTNGGRLSDPNRLTASSPEHCCSLSGVARTAACRTSRLRD
jgi:hypothetical protein